MTDIDQRIPDLWKFWCEQAAAKAGITVEELKRRLDHDEAYLEISVVIPASKTTVNIPTKEQ